MILLFIAIEFDSKEITFALRITEGMRQSMNRYV
jgi:hypothetical protein